MFVNFDTENFYLPISEKLLIDAIHFAKSSANITEQDLSIIMQWRKILLFQISEPWVKNLGNENLDIPMGCYDSAKVCELVGSFILNELTSIVSKSDVGLYHDDDGLGIFYNISRPEIERKWKAIVKVFKGCGLSITIHCNLLKTVDFLDMTFDLDNNVYKPFRQENNKPVYINKHSNHPPSILKQMPKSIEKRISETSSNKDVFDKSIKPYKDALKEGGFSEALNNIAPTTNKKQKNRKRKIIWFNPPFCKSVKSNIGRIFLRLYSKHFPRNHTMHKIFNRNTVKISYSCLRNISSIISSENHNILLPKQQSFGCNCRVKNEYPLNGECHIPSVIYRAEVVNESNDEEKFYFGLADTPLKKSTEINLEILNMRSTKTAQN